MNELERQRRLATIAIELIKIPEMTLNYDEWVSAQSPEYQERIQAARHA
jgi:hypothetical protein